MTRLGRLCTVFMLSVSIPVEASAATVAVERAVMASSFFTGTNLIRGHPGEGRTVLRVSTDEPFGLIGAETIYLAFDFDFAALAGPVTAVLTMQSVSGGFGADADAGHPFIVSVHALGADPLAAIVDDTNPGGTRSWLDFYQHGILPADPGAHARIDGFGPVTFDVSSVVNGWISGTNTIHAIALTGKNDVSGNDFLHGFLNASEASGVSFLTVTPAPEPEAYAMLLAGLGAVLWRMRRSSVRRTQASGGRP